MKRFGVILAIALLLITSAQSWGQKQELSTRSGKAKKSFEEGLRYYNLMEYKEAEIHFRDAIKADPQFVEAYIILGEMFYGIESYKEAIPLFEQSIEINPKFYKPVYNNLGQAYLLVGRYQDAKEKLSYYLSLEGISDKSKKEAEKGLLTSDFGIKAMENPKPFVPINLGEAINSSFAEYSPSLTADELVMVYTRKIPKAPGQGGISREQEDFFVSSQISEGTWTDAENLGGPINTLGNEGAQALSVDGKHLFFTACSRPDGFGSCDIYYSYRTGNTWSVPVNLGEKLNSRTWDSQPSISSDGKSLYFASAREGSLGQMDIWLSTKKEDGRWGIPENMGSIINTPGRDMSPFIHPDNQTLFFASDGHPGMGKLDIFYSRRQADGSWGQPENIGYPINTWGEEMSLVVTASGKGAFFASEQLEGFGDLDLYYFELYEAARPQSVTYMKGIVSDKENGKKLKANFQLIDVENSELIISSESDPVSGEFLVAIPLEKRLALNVSHTGYLFFSENFSYSASRDDLNPWLRDIKLAPIKAGEAVVLKNIFFQTNKYDLEPESIAELTKLKELLTSNPGMRIEISGHTDNTGNREINMSLSRNRAKAVVEYLIQNGIESSRITFEGYADTQPIDNNDTEEGRSRNRRTEFKVLD